MDETNKLDSDLAKLLDYKERKAVSVKNFISGFQTRLDKIWAWNLPDKLKGHIVLGQTNLYYNDRHIVTSATIGSYYVRCVGTALRNIYRNTKTFTCSARSVIK